MDGILKGRLREAAEQNKEQEKYFKNSKVRNKNGELLTVYHGTKTKGVKQLQWDPNRQTGTNFGEAYYFTTDKQVAERYAYDQKKDPKVIAWNEEKNKILESPNPKDWSKAFDLTIDGMDPVDYISTTDFNTGGEVLRAHLNIERPLIKDAGGKNYYDVYPDYFEEAKQCGYDGIIVKNIQDTAIGKPKLTDVLIVFSPNQIVIIEDPLLQHEHVREEVKKKPTGTKNKILDCKTLKEQIELAQSIRNKLSRELEKDIRTQNRFEPGHKFPELKLDSSNER